MVSPHYALYLFPFHAIDENYNVVKAWQDKIGHVNKIQINHYFTKSKEEWIKRRSFGMADHTDDKKRTLKDFEEYDNNELYDDSMLYYVEKIKQLYQ